MTSSTFFGAGTHPDIPMFLAHFTGRPRDGEAPAAVNTQAEDRLNRILDEDALRAAVTYGTKGPVVCFSEASAAALTTIFRTGVTIRGAYAPWAILLHRDRLLAAGVRPVWHMTNEELVATANLPTVMRDRRVRFIPGQVDWLAEREWRCCWGDEPMPPNHYPGLPIGDLLAGIIVGRAGWLPTPNLRPATYRGLPRWLWTGSQLIRDGSF